MGETIRVWAKIGVLSFGGPAGQIAMMHRIVVEEQRWISEDRFLHALNFCMILPGPEAQQLATYIGWLMHGIRGGLVAGTLFILPGFLVILGLSYLYVTAGELPLVQGLFLGLKAAVIAIVIQALLRIGRRSLDSQLKVALATLAFTAMFVFGVKFPYIILVAAAVGYWSAKFQPAHLHEKVRASPARHDKWRPLALLSIFGLLWLGPVAVSTATLGPENVFSMIGVFFSKMAVVTFGGAYAVLAYVAQEAVQVHHWLSANEMLDGLAMAETTPGPLINVVQFVGFMAAYRNPGLLPPAYAALLGSVLTTWVTFVPCFLWIFLGAPYMERIRQNRVLSGALAAVTAAVVGVIANLAAWFAIHAVFAEVQNVPFAGLALELPLWYSVRPPVLLIAVLALFLVFRLKASMPIILLAAGVCGITSSLI